MADILLFPAGRVGVAAHRLDAPRLQAAALAAVPEAAAWLGDDMGDNGDLGMVASLAAIPSRSLAALVTKMEVLVARLAPDDGTDAGLCIAEASLLRSVQRDLRTFAMDAAFAAQGADMWAPVRAVANPTQQAGPGSCAGEFQEFHV